VTKFFSSPQVIGNVALLCYSLTQFPRGFKHTFAHIGHQAPLFPLSLMMLSAYPTVTGLSYDLTWFHHPRKLIPGSSRMLFPAWSARHLPDPLAQAMLWLRVQWQCQSVSIV